jgi:hypothetical protein
MIALTLLSVLLWSDDGTNIGPEPGKPVPALKTHQVVGDKSGQEVDLRVETQDKPVIFIFIPSEKWDRPIARFLRQLDEAIQGDRQKDEPRGQIYLVWVTKDVEKAKEYLPRAQQSIKLQASTWNILRGEVYDAQDWALSGDSALNIIIAKKNKVAWGKAYASVNDGLARTVRQAWKGQK